MRARGPKKRRSFMGEALHQSRRALGSIDHFLAAHGEKIRTMSQQIAPVLATKAGPYGPAIAAGALGVGELTSGYAAIRSQMGG